MANTTDYLSKVEILSEVWLDYRDDESFAELFEFADVGFPLAYVIDNGIVESSDQAETFIEQTFELLLKMLGLEDTGFDGIVPLFDAAEKVKKDEE